MNETHALQGNYDGAGLYEIRLKGHLNNRWASRLGEVSITLEDNGNTLLICSVVDQAALHGLLKKVRDLGIPLVSVNPHKGGRVNKSDVDK